MEPIFKGSEKIMGLEVLSFNDAEVEKDSSFATFGTLNVLYFKHYNRFVLQLNDWKFPLLRRIPIIASNKTEMKSRTYLMPAPHGTYRLTLNNIDSLPTLANFETILTNNTMFSYRGDSDSFRKAEASPDDKVMRHSSKSTGPMEMITEAIKGTAEKIMHAAGSFKSGTKHLTSKKHRINQKDIITKDFSKTPSKIKKDLLLNASKLSKDFTLRKKENPNQLQTKDYSSLKNSSDSLVPAIFLVKEEVEDAILNFKDLALKGNFNLNMDKFDIPHKSSQLSENIPSMSIPLPSIGTTRINPEPLQTESKGLESISHYSG